MLRYYVSIIYYVSGTRLTDIFYNKRFYKIPIEYFFVDINFSSDQKISKKKNKKKEPSDYHNNFIEVSIHQYLVSC